MEPIEREDCPVSYAIGAIGGRWKPVVLWQLREGALRFGELRRLVPGSTQKVLTEQLRQLEADGIVSRAVLEEKPLRVEYSLSEYGETLKPLLALMCEWGRGHRERSAGERG